MYRIGEAKGIKLYAPNDAYFSYFNSPYIAHSHISAIDVYPNHQDWGGPVITPTAGKIVRIQRTKMGRRKEFPTEEYDFGIAIQPDASANAIVRILHCKPTVQEGTIVDQGDQIGTTIRSRYFNYWTGPHFHIEVMHIDTFQRSTRSYPIDVPFRYSATKIKEILQETEFTVSSVTEDCLIGYPRDLSHTSIGNYSGLSAIDSSKKIAGILDGGISHYKQGGVIGHEFPKYGQSIGLQNIQIGSVQKHTEYASFFSRIQSVSSYLNDKELRGLSCFVYPKEYNRKGIPPLVLVPKSYNEFKGVISEGDLCTLKVDSANNMIKAE